MLQGRLSVPFSASQDILSQRADPSPLESPFSIRQPSHWLIPRSSSSSGCLSFDGSGLNLNGVPEMSADQGLIRATSDGALDQSCSSQCSQRSLDGPPERSCSLPDASWLIGCQSPPAHDVNPASPAAEEPAPAPAAEDPQTANPPTPLATSSPGPFHVQRQLQPMSSPRGHLGPLSPKGQTWQRRTPGLKRQASQSLSVRMNEMQLASDRG